MKIICIGRNYVEHARELNNPLPEAPVFFMKPDTSLVIRNRPFFYPEFSKDIHYETELVIKISKNGKHIQEKFAHTYYDEIGLGIDFTARDIQSKCKEKGLPWEVAKAFDHSAPISKFIKLDELQHKDDIRFYLELNGVKVQDGSSTLMIFSVDHIISYLSQFVTLKMGDLIFTGTPAGVGPVKINDHLVGYIEDKKMLDFRVK
ncbi:MAG TPA: fumarylacetoacetate hydrolase family protein [Bacteroidales bacterium]|nr:fumarylacetoacetate hydrolase family protein [Bacteroidales bacterium]HPE58173.1 fumarylacetoacetate hydrolase family protein [Bacteroidales bacterium]HRX96416.1 fumarylacetoacetate hydrolase family protein [Bacteroidales bacterium]